MTLSLFEFLQYSTVKINCVLRNGDSSSGTGFFYRFNINDKDTATVLVTNKHVVEDASIGKISITMTDNAGNPDYSNIEEFVFNNFEGSWINHPEGEIDLCIFPLSELMSKINKEGKKPFYAALGAKEMPDFINTTIYKPTEDIYMIGYPNGLGDDRHNLPITRKGITGTPFFIDHNDLPEFIVDCACFPGSSGSPVLIVNESSYALNRGNLQSGSRMVLLGVLYAGPQYDAQGKLHKYKVPTKNYITTNIPMNLGYCVSSKKLNDFIPILKKMN